MFPTERVDQIFAASAILRNLQGVPEIQNLLRRQADRLIEAATIGEVNPMDGCRRLVEVKRVLRVVREDPAAWRLQHAIAGVLLLLVG